MYKLYRRQSKKYAQTDFMLSGANSDSKLTAWACGIQRMTATYVTRCCILVHSIITDVTVQKPKILFCYTIAAVMYLYSDDPSSTPAQTKVNAMLADSCHTQTKKAKKEL